MASNAIEGVLEEMVIGGVKTSIPLHQALMKDPDFINGDYTIKWLEEWLAKRAGRPRTFAASPTRCAWASQFDGILSSVQLLT